MKPTIGEILIQERRQPIEYEGRLVYGRFPVEVHEGQRLLLRLKFNRPDLRQAVSLKITKGSLEVNGESVRYPILWCDTAPVEVEVVCHPGKRIKTATVWVWNHWEAEDRRADAGWNNAGIIVEESSPGRTVLACSPGRRASEAPDFQAVRVEILTSEALP